MEIHLGCRISPPSLKQWSPMHRAGVNPANLTPSQHPQGTCPSFTPAPSGVKAGKRAGTARGTKGSSPGFAVHPSTPLPELHPPRSQLPWSRFLHLTVGQGNRAAKNFEEQLETGSHNTSVHVKDCSALRGCKTT